MLERRTRQHANEALGFVIQGLKNREILLSRSSQSIEMKPFRLVSSVYMPSYILHSLGCAMEDGDLTKVIARFLLDQMDKGNRGIWRFFGRSRSSPPPDFDDTCCVLASL